MFLLDRLSGDNLRSMIDRRDDLLAKLRQYPINDHRRAALADMIRRLDIEIDARQPL